MTNINEFYNSAIIKYLKYASTLSIIISIIFLYTRNISSANLALLIAVILAVPFVLLKLVLFLRWIWQFNYVRTFVALAISFLTLLASGVSLSLAKQLIHASMQIDPTYFPSSLIIVSAFFLIPSWLFILITVMFIFWVIILLYEFIIDQAIFLGKKLPRFTGDFVDSLCFSMGYLGILFFAALVYDGVINSVVSSNLSTTLIQKLAIGFDYYSSSECIKLRPNQYFAYIGDDKISVASFNFIENKYILTTASCNK